MKLLLSIPSGYHARELLLPLHEHLEQDDLITEVVVVTPAADTHAELFAQFSDMFTWLGTPADTQAASTLLREQKPDVVVAPTAGLDTRDAPLLAAARQDSIPTCVFVSSWDNVFKMERLHQRGYSGGAKGKDGGLVLPDFLGVWNQMNRDHLLQSFPSLKPEQVEIVGAPRFDYFAHEAKIPSKTALFDYLKIAADPEDTALIHCATTELYPFEYIIKQLAAARDAEKLQQPVHLYASVHPGGDMAKHNAYKNYGVTTRYSFGRRETAPHPDFRYLPTTQEIYLLAALFKHTSVLVNQSSTVAIESMRADVPVINVTYGQPLDWWHWYRSMVYRDFKEHYRYITDENGTTLVKKPKELIAALNTYLKNPELKSAERKKTIKKMITYTDGTAGQRLLDLIKRSIR